MRVDFVQFIDERGNNVFINPLLVRYFHAVAIDDEEFTRIVFDNENSILLKSSPVEVEIGLTILDSE